jgi:hypothetical protein
VSGPEAVGAWIVAASLGTTLVIIAKAVAKRIGGGSGGHEVDALRDEVESLRGELDAIHGRLREVDEIQSRLDFAERVLAQKDKNVLPGNR